MWRRMVYTESCIMLAIRMQLSRLFLARRRWQSMRNCRPRNRRCRSGPHLRYQGLYLLVQQGIEPLRLGQGPVFERIKIWQLHIPSWPDASHIQVRPRPVHHFAVHRKVI